MDAGRNFPGGGRTDSLCRGFSVAGTQRIDKRVDRIDRREPRLEGYTDDTQRVQVANRSSLSPPLPRPNHNLNHAFRTV